MLRRILAPFAALGIAFGLALGLFFTSPAARAEVPAEAPSSAEAVMRPAPEWKRPAVPEPSGGWTVQEGLYGDVHSTWGDRVIARRLSAHLATSVPALAARLGLYPGDAVEVYLVDNEIDFHRMQPGATPDWADGTAWPNMSLVFLKSPTIRAGDAAPLETVLDHEIVHVLLGQAFGGRPVPRWLQEGYAQFFSGEASERSMRLAHNELGLAPMPLAELTQGFPANGLRAQIAYGESADFVAWIAGRGGEEGLRKLVARLADGATVDDALFSAAGISLANADIEWMSTVPTAKPWFRWLTNTNLWWSIGAVALVVGAYRRRRRSREKLARWEAEDRARAAAILERQEAAWREANETVLPIWVGAPALGPRPRRVMVDPRWN